MPAKLPNAAKLPPATARKRAQRAVPMGPCAKCGSRVDVERHHKSLSDPQSVTLLCKKCHVKLERAAGGWGKFKSANLASLKAARDRGTQTN